jgi:hypothetical protein
MDKIITIENNNSQLVKSIENKNKQTVTAIIVTIRKTKD